MICKRNSLGPCYSKSLYSTEKSMEMWTAFYKMKLFAEERFGRSRDTKNILHNLFSQTSNLMHLNCFQMH